MALKLLLKTRDWSFWTPLLLGDVKSDKLDLRVERVASLVDNVADDPDADACETSFSRYNLRVDQGTAQGVAAVPYFIMRGFRTRNIITVNDSPLTDLRELEGKTIGLSGWQDSGNTWTRALLRRAGVDLSTIHWVLTRCTSADKIEPKRGSQFWNGDTIVHEPDERPLVDLLHEKKIDAMFQAFMPKGYYNGELGLRPLVPDFVAHEAAYYRDTGYVPGIHILTFKQHVVDENPWVVKELCSLLDASRALWREKREHYIEDSAWAVKCYLDEGRFLKPDVEGFAANERMINDFGREAFEQGLTKHQNTAEDLFGAHLL